MRTMKYVALFAVALVLAVGALVQVAPAGFLSGSAGDWISNFTGVNIYPQSSSQTTAFRVEDTSGNDTFNVAPGGTLTIAPGGTTSATWSTSGISGPTVATRYSRYVDVITTTHNTVYFYLPDEQTSYTLRRIEVLLQHTAATAGTLFAWNFYAHGEATNRDKILLVNDVDVTTSSGGTYNAMGNGDTYRSIWEGSQLVSSGTKWTTITGGDTMVMQFLSGSNGHKMEIVLEVDKYLGDTRDRY